MLRLRRGEPHESTTRSETFSDGVFAVAITLLALDLVNKIHATYGVGNGTMFAAIGHYWPVLLAFAASFAAIGVAWMVHHNVFARVDRLSRALNGANLFLLATIVMVPWVTAALAEALTQQHGQQEVVVYAAVSILQAVSWFILLTVLARSPDLLVSRKDAEVFHLARYNVLFSITASIVGGLIGFFWSPVAATALFFAMPVFFAVTSEGFERRPRSNTSVSSRRLDRRSRSEGDGP